MLDLKGVSRIIYSTISFLVILFTVLNFMLLQGSTIFNTYSLIISMLVFSLLSVMVLIKLFNNDESDIELHKHPYFWISAATLLFSAGALILLGLQQFIEAEKIQIGKMNLYRVIMPVLIVVMYSSYIYAFILCRKLNKSS